MPEVADSVGTVVTLGAERLREAGVADPRREALQLWADVRDTSPAAALLGREEPVAVEIQAEFLRRIARRAAGEPRAYVSGVVGFRRLTLACDRRALIPRPETEGLVDLLLARVKTGRAADIGTGTGCLALSLATEGQFHDVVGVDRSPEALALARFNGKLVEAAGVVERPSAALWWARGDLCSALQTASLDALVSNPPYLSDQEYATIDPGVRDWEPRMALVSGADGLDATTRLLDDARRVLRPGGWLAMELDSTRAAETARRGAALGLREVAIYKDLFGRERYLLARRSELS